MTKDSCAPSRSRIFALLQLLALLTPLLLSPLAAAQSAPPDVRFGVVEAFRASKDAAALSLGWERAIFFWNQIQPNGPNEWNDFYFEDSWLADATANGRQIVGLLEGTPLWATDGTSSAAVPRGLSLPIDDPNNLWATFVRTIVRRYAGRIDHWIIWNEPDIAPGEYGVQWDGSVADFVRLTKVAYLVAKQENPNAVIHFAGLTYWHDVVNGRRLYLQRYLDEARKDPLAAENNYFFDAISLHIYFTSDTVYDITSTFAEVLRRNGLSQAIWINETNAPPFNDWLNPWTIPDWKVTLDQQAGFIVQAFAQGLAAGAQRIAVYKMVDFPPYPPGYEPYGLVRSDGSRRPAFAAMRTVIKHFAGTRSATMDRTTTRTLVTLDRGNKTTRVLWARGKASVPVTLPAFAPQAILVRHLGGTRIITPINGVYSLTLPGALCADPLHGCAVGGAPLLLVEEASLGTATQPQPTGDAVTVTATPSPTPTATRSPSPTPTLTPTVTASATPTATRTLAPSPTATQTPVPSPRIAPNPSSISGLVALALAGAVMLATWVLNRREQGSRRDHSG